MIVLFTDFGVTDPYVGQMRAVLVRGAPHIPVIDLLHAVPDFDIRAGAYLLAALAADFPAGTVFVGVVDPGVGGQRTPVIVEVDGRWYVGPDNGLFHIVERRATRTDAWLIEWRPQRLSSSFHGRDLFAPVAAKLARGDWPASVPTQLTPPPGDWPDDLPAIIYVDHYGNAITGQRASKVDRTATLEISGKRIRPARVFSDVTPGEPFWYENSSGLVEIAVAQGSAARLLGLALGSTLQFVSR